MVTTVSAVSCLKLPAHTGLVVRSGLRGCPRLPNGSPNGTKRVDLGRTTGGWFVLSPPFALDRLALAAICIAEECRSVPGLGVIAVDNLLLDPAAVRHSDAFALSPFADGPVLVAVHGGAPAPTCSARACRAGGAGDLCADSDIWREGVAHFRGVLLGQIDLVLSAVDGKLDGLLCLSSVDVVDQHVDRSLSHQWFLPNRAYRLVT